MRTPSRLWIFLSAIALCAAVDVAQAAPITYSVTVDLSFLHPGSSYSGSATVATALNLGDSTTITLFATPSNQYLPSSINDTLSIGSGPFGFNSVFISPLVFTDASTSKQYNLIVSGPAHCDVTSNPNGIPCQTSGQLIGNNANGGFTTYAISILPATVPEPAYGVPLLVICVLLAIKRRAGASNRA